MGAGLIRHASALTITGSPITVPVASLRMVYAESVADIISGKISRTLRGRPLQNPKNDEADAEAICEAVI